jgi:mRNA interferase MazF
MNCSHHDIVLLPVPFTDLSSSKVRPAIVIGHGSFAGDVFVVPVTSQLGNADFAIHDWRGAGLNVPSGVKSQIATIDTGLVRRVVGRLQPADAATLDANLRQWLNL